VNSDKAIKEGIQHRITLGNKAYYANQFVFKSGLVSKKSKLKLYCSIIRPTGTYGCETWVWKGTMKNKLMVQFYYQPYALKNYHNSHLTLKSLN